MKDSIPLEVIKEASLTFDTNLGTLDKVLSWFDLFDHSFIPRKDWLHCQLALAEGFTNAVRHAHREVLINHPIEISIKIFYDHLEMRIWDYGEPFDLKEQIDNMVKMHHNHSSGQRGLLILEQIADKLDYIRWDDKRNCLLIFKEFYKEIQD